MIPPELSLRCQDAFQIGIVLPRELRLLERELQSKKWFDYRFISPLKATCLFREEFIKTFQSFHGRVFDSSEAKTRYGCRTGPFTSTDLLIFWKARQFADSLSVPYRTFLWSTFELVHAAGWQRLPKANQLYGKHESAIAAAVTKTWAEKCDSFVQVSELPNYRNELFRSLPDQKAHRTWVIEQIRKNGVSPHTIGRICFELRVIPEELANAEFGAVLVDQARELVAKEVRAEKGTTGGLSLPSCFAVSEPDLTVAACKDCPCTALCFRFGSSARAEVKAKYGSEDRATDRKRAQVAARVRKHRAKKAALAAAAARTPAAAAAIGTVT